MKYLALSTEWMEALVRATILERRIPPNPTVETISMLKMFPVLSIHQISKLKKLKTTTFYFLGTFKKPH